MTSEQSIERLIELVVGMHGSQAIEAARLGAVRSVNGPDGAKTRVSVAVVVERVQGRYQIVGSAQVTQTQTDTLDTVEDGFDPLQPDLPGVGKKGGR